MYTTQSSIPPLKRLGKVKRKSILTTYYLLLTTPLGFTLIELIIAMAIVAILAGALWGNFFSSIGKGRDSRRKQDLELIGKSLELYYNDTKAYPTALPSWGYPFAHPTYTSVIYMQKLPADPSHPNQDYCYRTDTGGSYYQIYANLENRSDPKAFVTPVRCSTVDYNYGISSPNITP